MTLFMLATLGSGIAVLAVLLFARWLESRTWRRRLVALKVRVPHDTSTEQIAQWLARMQVLTESPFWALISKPPIALELVATRAGITMFVLSPPSLSSAIITSTYVTLPGARVDEVSDYLRTRPPVTIAAEAKLTSLVRPLAIERAAETAGHLLASLLPQSANSTVVVQWMVSGVPRPKPRQLQRRSTASGSEPWWLDLGVAADAEAIRAEREKYRSPLLAACLRVGVATHSKPQALQLLGRVWPTLSGMDAAGVRLVRRWLPAWVVSRRLDGLQLPLLRFPLLVNVAEAAGLVGLARKGLSMPGLPGAVARALPAPPSVPTRGLVVADTNFPGQTRPLALLRSDRLRHLWYMGPTGSGKSTLLLNMVEQDMHAGDGFILFDARGDLVYDVLDRVPPARRDDVILMDAANTSSVVGFNPLGLGRTERERELTAEHVLSVLHSLYHASWGVRTADVLRASLLTLVNAQAVDGERLTLAELPELLTNDAFRLFILHQPLPPSVRPFWQWYQNLSDAERTTIIAPSLNKLRQFTLSTPLRLMLGQSNGVNLSELFTKQRIILVPLKRGLLGGETTTLIGSLLMAAVWDATLARADVPPEKRQPTWLYADEFQSILRLPIDLTDMLAQARGLGLGLVLSHQYMDQLTAEMRAAVVGTTKSQLVFQLGYNDARTLAPHFGPLTADDLRSLGPHEIAFKPAVRGQTLAPITGVTRPPSAPTGERDALIAHSLARYARSAVDIDTALLRRRQAAPDVRGNRRTKGGQV